MLFIMINDLNFYIRDFLSMSAVSTLAVGCCCSVLPFPGMLLKCFHVDFEMVSAAPLAPNSIIFIFTSHMRCTSIVKYRCILDISWLIFLSHFGLLKLQHLLIFMCFSHYLLLLLLLLLL
jgi:hypothetical protein